MQTDVSCLRVRLEDAILKDKWEFSSRDIEQYFRERQAHGTN